MKKLIIFKFNNGVPPDDVVNEITGDIFKKLEDTEYTALVSFGNDKDHLEVIGGNIVDDITTDELLAFVKERRLKNKMNK